MQIERGDFVLLRPRLSTAAMLAMNKTPDPKELLEHQPRPSTAGTTGCMQWVTDSGLVALISDE